jgi:glycerophosphoryl diester phosphodiesterase
VVPGFQSLIRKTFAVIGWWFTPLRMAILIITITAGSLAVSFFLISEPADHPGVQVIAHRANAMGAPENSMVALENSILVGADMAEIDVQMTADGTVIVLHDADFMRAAGDPRRVRDVNFDEISSLRLHSNLDFPESKLRIPTLEDFLEISRGNIVLMIELKYYGFYPELAEKVTEIVRRFEMEDEVLLMSLSLEAVQELRTLAPDMKLGYVSAAAAGDLTRLDVDFLAVSQQAITPRLISSSYNRNIPVYAWTVNNTGEMIDAIKKGVNGLITDETEEALRISGEMAKLTMAERLLLQFGFVMSEN